MGDAGEDRQQRLRIACARRKGESLVTVGKRARRVAASKPDLPAVAVHLGGEVVRAACFDIGDERVGNRQRFVPIAEAQRGPVTTPSNQRAKPSWPKRLASSPASSQSSIDR